ncbi:MAG TPA: VCBS repeat-containing protein, partial [Cyclobacteriaceae bacterium]|nr:VCBS repeat-containing protein [Cyclobacteriaceae bacterium]
MKRVLITILFIILLAAPAFLKKNSQPASGSPLPEREKAALLETYGFYFEDVTDDAGIDFIHQSPVLDPQLKPILPQIASMGAAAAVSDFDKDGWYDIYVTNSREDSRNALYHNQKDGTFIDIAGTLNIADVNKAGTGVSMGAVWGDYDNDGYEDLFIYKWGMSELYRNIEGKDFQLISGDTGLPAWANANTAVWFDYNADGLLDLFIGCYYREDIDLWNLKSTVIMPESF